MHAFIEDRAAELRREIEALAPSRPAISVEKFRVQVDEALGRYLGIVQGAFGGLDAYGMLGAARMVETAG